MFIILASNILARRRTIFARKISDYLKKIQRAVRDDELLVRADMVSCIKCHEFVSAPLIGLWTYGNRINPSLSFVKGVQQNSIEFDVSGGTLARLGYPKDIQNFIAMDNTHLKENYIVYSPSTDVNSMHLEALSECLSLISRRSANAANLSIALGSRINAIVANKVRWQSGSDFLEALISAGDPVSDLLGFASLILKLSPNNDIQIEHFYSPLMDSKLFSYGQHSYLEARSYFNMRDNTALRRNISNLPKNCAGLFKLGINLIKHFEDNSLDLQRFYSDLVTGTVLVLGKKIIIQPIPVGGEFVGDRYFYIFLPKEKLRTRDIYSASSFSREFAERYKQSKRISLLSNQSGRTLVRSTEITKTGIQKEFQREFKKLAKDTFSVINCHSVTVRMNNPASNSLVLYAEASTDEADDSDIRLRQNANSYDTDISLNKFKTSVNAFTYLFSDSGFEYVYLRNLNAKIPKEYKDKGLDRATQYRETSLSEFCMPFRFGNVTIGTVNLESSLKRAFDDDIEFLLLFRSALEDLYRKHFEVFDLEWYKLLTKFADPLHELENFLDTDFFDSSQKSVLRDLFISGKKIDEDKSRPMLADLTSWFDDWVRSYYRKESRDFKDDIKSIVEFNIEKDVNLQPAVFSAITAIIKNLITNIEDHSYIRRDKIIISNSTLYRGRPEDGKNLRIRYKTFGYFDNETLEAFCLRPIERSQPNENTRHYGAFVLGLLARSVGGYVVVDKSDKGYPVFVEFTIPIQE